jgi:ArsR family transcriptional regulator
MLSVTGISTDVNTKEKTMANKMATRSAPAGDTLCCPSLTDAPLKEEEAVALARVLSALADPARLRLLSLVASQEEICSCELEAPLGKSQPTISHHTKVLADAGLLVGEKRGRWMWWRVEPERLAVVRAALGG